MVDIHDYDIALVEKEILMKYNDNRYGYADYGCLLSLRKDMINKRVLAHQEEILPDIVAFNDALTEALREFHHLFQHMKFAITGFIYIRKFETEIKVEINKTV